jgi:hypothetical protein
MAKTAMGLFDRRTEAEEAIQELVHSGFKQEDVCLVSGETWIKYCTHLTVPEPEARYYAEALRREGTLLSVNTEDDRADRVARNTLEIPTEFDCHFCVVQPELEEGNSISELSFTRAATLGLLALLTVLLCPAPLAAAPVRVRFAEGAMHGFLVLRTADGPLIASGDLLQVGRGGQVESRMVFRFKDGSVFDERVVFTQRRVFTLQSYRLMQRGPVFAEDTEISLEPASGNYRVKTKARQHGREKVLEGALDLPQDIYNGMFLTVAKNLPKGSGETVHVVAFTPKPRLIQLELAPVGEHQVLVGELAKTAVHYVFKPQLGTGLKLLATLLGRVPPDCHAWIVTGEVPAFARFEGPLYPTGPVWRIELASPRWPE